MFYRGRELRRVWKVKVYTGNPDVKKPKTGVETVVAWNAVDAIRRMGAKKVAEQPTSMGYITWPEKKGDPVFFIKSTKGPTDEKVNGELVKEEDWDS